MKLSSDAISYSRFDTSGKYAPGGVSHADGRRAPLEGLVGYAVYCGAAVVLSLAWLVLTRLTLEGSVMGSNVHFVMGMVVLIIILAGGGVVGVAHTFLSRGRDDMDAGTTVALSFGKAAVAMLIAVAVWFACALVAAS